MTTFMLIEWDPNMIIFLSLAGSNTDISPETYFDNSITEYMREFFVTTSGTGIWILHIKILRTSYVSATSILDKEARAAFI